MKRIFVLGLSLSLLAIMATAAAAADDTIEFYFDNATLSCELLDQTPAFVQVHMFHMGSLPAVWVAFYAPTPACWVGASYLGDVIVPEFLAQNSSHNVRGLLVNYLECLTPPQYLGYVSFWASGTAQPCCVYGPSDIPASGERMYAWDCDSQSRRFAAGRPVVINPDESCHCLSPVPVEATSWGQIKALYR